MKKKILFVLSDYYIGGTTVSTRNLISVLNKDKYEIIVWVLHPEGILQWMYEDIRTFPSCFLIQSLSLHGWREERNWIRRIGAAFIRFAAKHSPSIHHSICVHSIRKCLGEKHFDTIVACQEGELSYIVSHFNCQNLVAWVRCDYKRYLKDIRGGQKEDFYESYNHIVCVSEGTCNGFKIFYPNLSQRVVCIQNPQDSGLIKSQSEINDKDDRFLTDQTVFVSIGRLNKVKRFVEIPRIARELIEEGILFKWYIIGDGDQEAAIKESIEQNDVSGSVIMLGAKRNPHFYIKNADLYVCLSSSEACPRVVNEAKILGTPVVSTDFPTIYEYIEDGVNGKIVPLEGVKDAIIELIKDKALYNRIKDKIEGFTFDNKGLIDQLERIL